MTLMPEQKTWEKEGVRITFLCFETMLSLKVQKVMRDEYLRPSADNPENAEVPTAVYIFYKAMPLIMAVDLVDDAPLWGQVLKREIEGAKWLNDPVADFRRIERTAPEALFFTCYDGFLETREQAYIAPPELRKPEPQPPQPDPDTGEVDANAQNFTNSNTPNGGTPLTVMPSVKHGAPLSSTRRKAK